MLVGGEFARACTGMEPQPANTALFPSREELIAEMTAALCGIRFGLATTPQQENAAYLASWLRGLKEKPEYLFDILIDANKAATMIADRVEESSAKPDETAA